MVNPRNILRKHWHKHWLFVIAAIVIILDQLTKLAVRHYSLDIEILPFFSITYITNTGGAFGIFKGVQLLFIITAIAVVGLIIYYYKKIPNDMVYVFTIGLFLGGTLGNLIDRLFLGKVTDFIAFSFWPAFNIADSCLCIAVVLWLIMLLCPNLFSSQLSKGSK